MEMTPPAHSRALAPVQLRRRCDPGSLPFATSAEDIEDLAAYLNRRFYHLPCPIAGCAADKIGQH